jgi:hypothetical protein
MINTKFVTALFSLLALVSCSPRVPVSQPTDTNSSYPLSPAVSTETLIPTEKPTTQPTFTPTVLLSSTPLVAIPPYQTKQAVLEYTRLGGALGSPDFLFDGFFDGFRETTQFVLYADGQFILQEPLEPISTKTLTENERMQLLSLLEETRFYSIEANGKLDPTNPIYDFGDKYTEESSYHGVTSCLIANVTTSKKICFYEPYRDFLVPPMQELFRFVYDYTPINLTVYQPDRLLVFVSKGHDFYDSFAGESEGSIPWLSDLPSLETSQEKYMYVEGENAAKIFSLFETNSSLKLFSQAGQDYSVLIEVVFPHETLTQP